jgi:hypothetical protein
MTIKRRDFLKSVGSGAVAAGLYVPGVSAVTGAHDWSGSGAPAQPVPPSEETSQKLHADFCSDIPGGEYYLLGNGLIQAVLQTVPEGNPETHCGLLIMSPAHFGRKVSTFLYHPERGLERSLLTVNIDGTGYLPAFNTTTVQWTYPNQVPTLVVGWEAGACRITEEYVCPIGAAVLLRTITVHHGGSAPAKASGVLLLSPNFMFFDEYDVDRTKMTLTARGYHRLQLFSTRQVTVGDRHMAVDFGTIPPGESRPATFVMTLDHPREEVERQGLDSLRTASADYWGKRATLNTGHDGLDHLFRASESGIRAAVASSGKMDGSIWQYNQEWVRDQSWVALASAMLGHTDIAHAMFERILSLEIDDEGKTLESSRLRPPETFELDQNGEVLYALRNYWTWTGDDSFMRRYWKRISALADFVLQPVFYDPAVGLLKNSREYWERDSNMGVREGYEISYQLFTVLGLEAAAEMARFLDQQEPATRWSATAKNIQRAMVSHPRYSLVDNGHFTKRRQANGEVQVTMTPVNRKSMPPGSPLGEESISYCDADTSVVLPIAFEVIDPKSPLALNTLKFVERLWNQRWKGGGYGRYDATSEPDSPGPWPFASLFVARAYFEAGDDEKVWRVLNWLNQVQGGKAGSWLEFYGKRSVPPLPPIGIVPWTWGEIAIFFMHHVLGIRPSPSELLLRPALLNGLDRIEARVPVRGVNLRMVIRKTTGTHRATIDGKRVPVRDGKVSIPFPQRETVMEFEVPAVESTGERKPG